MKSPLYAVVSIVLVTLFGDVCADGQILDVGYDFNYLGYQYSDSVPATWTDDSITLSDVTRGAGFSNNGGNPVTNNTTGMALYPVNNSWSLTAADAQTNNQFVTFTLTPTETVSLGTLNFGVGIQNGGGYAALAYSTDGGATFTFLTPSSATGGGANYDVTNSSFDLSAQAGLQGLTSGTTVIFQLFDLSGNPGDLHNPWEDGVIDDGTTSGMDIEVTGIIGAAVPEPSPYAMLIGGLTVLFFRLHFRRVSEGL